MYDCQLKFYMRILNLKSEQNEKENEGNKTLKNPS